MYCADTDFGILKPKKIDCTINKYQFCAAKLANFNLKVERF